MGYKFEFELNNVNLHRLGIPYPTSWSFVPYSRVEVRGDGSSAGFGFPVATWSWETMSQAQLHQLLGYFSATTDASISLTVQTYNDTAANLFPQSYTAFMHRPVDGEGKSLSPRVNPQRAAYTAVTVRFTRLE